MDYQSHLFCFILIVVSPLVFFKDLFDDTLVSRFTFVSAFLLLYAFLYFKDIVSSVYFSKNPLDYLIVGYYLWHLLSMLWATNVSEAFYSCQKASILPIVFFLVKGILNKKDSLSLVLKCTGLLSLIISIFVGYQLIEVYTIVGFDRYTVGSITGFSGNKNILSGFLLFLVPLNGAGFYFSKRGWKWLHIIAILITLLIIWQLRTRSVYSSLILFCTTTILLWVVYRFKSNTIGNIFITLFVIGISTMTLIITLGYAPDISSYFDFTPGSNTGTLAERLVLWSKTGELINQNPILGVGTGNWKIALPEIGLDGLTRAVQGDVFFARPHNDWLQILSETGVIGFFIWIGIWSCILYIGIKSLLSTTKKKDIILHILLCSGLIGLALFSSFSFPIERIEFSVFLGIYLAILSSFALEKGASISGKKSWFVTLGVIGIVAVLLINTTLGILRMTKERQSFVVQKALNYNTFNIARKALKNTEHPLYTITPTGTPIAYYDGILHLQNKDFTSAISSFNNALNTSPGHIASHINMGIAYSGQGELNKAIKKYKDALEISSELSAAHFNLALLYLNQKDKENALFHFHKISDDFPEKQSIEEAILKLNTI